MASEPLPHTTRLSGTPRASSSVPPCCSKESVSAKSTVSLGSSWTSPSNKSCVQEVDLVPSWSALYKSDVLKAWDRGATRCPTKSSIIKVGESRSIVLSKGQNMVAVTYDHPNGCKCHNWACSCEGNAFVHLDPSQSSLGNAQDTASYLKCPSFGHDFCLHRLRGRSLSAFTRLSLVSLFVSKGGRWRGLGGGWHENSRISE